MASGYSEIVTWEIKDTERSIALLGEFFEKYGVDGYSVFLNAEEFPFIRIYGMLRSELYYVVRCVLAAESNPVVTRIRVNNDAKRYMIDMLEKPTQIQGAFRVENLQLILLSTTEENEIADGGYSFSHNPTYRSTMVVAW